MIRIKTNSTTAVAISAPAVEVGRVGHFQHNVRRQRAESLQRPARHRRLVARDHNHGHRLADGAAHTQNDGGKDAGFRRGQDGEEYAALMAGAERERAFVIAFRHRADGRFRYVDDGRQDHNAQNDRRGQHARAAAAESVADGGYDDRQPEKAVYDRGDARQQVHGGLQEAVESGRTEMDPETAPSGCRSARR